MVTLNYDLADVAALQAEACRRVEGTDVAVVVSKKVTTPHATRTTVYLPLMPVPMRADDFYKLRYFIIHETGHVRRPESYDLLEAEVKHLGTLPPCEIGIWNIVEDFALEREIAEKSAGDADSMSTGARLIISENIAKLKSGLDIEESEDTAKMFAVHAMATVLYAKLWDSANNDVRTEFADAIPPPARLWRETLEREGWHTRLLNVRTPVEAADYAKDLCRRLFDQRPAPASRKKVKAKARPKDLLTWKEFFRNRPHTNAGEGGEPWSPSIDWTGYDYAKTPPAALLPSFVVRAQPANSRLWTPQPTVDTERFRIALLAKTRSRTLYGAQSGKLDRRKIGRLLLGPAAGRLPNDIWKRRIEGKSLSTALYILADSSASMRWDRKHYLCADCLCRLEQLFVHTLRMPTEFASFTTNANDKFGSVTNAILRPFGDYARNYSVAETYFQFTERNSCGNADGESILLALPRLTARREPRKILVVLSDGMPADCSPATDVGADTILRWAIECAGRRGVEVYGIGMLSDHVTKLYDKSRVVMRINELDRALLDLLTEVKL
ncbi:MAG: hypothetical protein NZM12_11695 [Steroidobacteraceae bacterium]|nr:hypothetical protein [Steroidobacteraceae bacterium]MDW8259511.1 hypothetical protein [Gammaproteobacteria bacterium]